MALSSNVKHGKSSDITETVSSKPAMQVEKTQLTRTFTIANDAPTMVVKSQKETPSVISELEKAIERVKEAIGKARMAKVCGSLIESPTLG
jgi:hypothetical protein